MCRIYSAFLLNDFCSHPYVLKAQSTDRCSWSIFFRGANLGGGGFKSGNTQPMVFQLGVVFVGVWLITSVLFVYHVIYSICIL